MQPPPGNIVPTAGVGTPQVPFHPNTQDSASHMSQLPGALFRKDRCSTISGSDQEICDQEVHNITRTSIPSETPTIVMSPRPGSSSTTDYTIQGDPDQSVHSPQCLTVEQQWFLNTHNFLLPDGSGRYMISLFISYTPTLDY